MECESLPIGAAGEAQTPSASVPQAASGSDPSRRLLERRLAQYRHAALHDPLTGLANRSLILDHLQLALARADRRSTLAAVVFLDLDGFKPINDTLGHGAGDEVLVRIAERLRLAIRPADTAGRWGGDEFVVVCEDLERASDVPAIVARIATVFDQPFQVSGSPLHVAASIGVAVSGGGNDDAATLIHAADAAMYRTKRAGRSTPAFPPAAWRSKLDRLTESLLHLLSSLEVDDTSADREQASEGAAA